MLQEVTEQIEKMARAVCDEIHTAMPGKIISFDNEKITAVVQPVGRFVTSSGNRLEYPRISDCPVVFPFSSSANAGIVFPVCAGDDCMIIFSETELDEWRTGAQSQSHLKFDLSSAVIIPGISRRGYVGSIVSDKSVLITAGNNILKVSESGIEIKGNVIVNGNIISNGDITAGNISVKNHVHISSTAGSSTGKPV